MTFENYFPILEIVNSEFFCIMHFLFIYVFFFVANFCTLLRLRITQKDLKLPVFLRLRVTQKALRLLF